MAYSISDVAPTKAVVRPQIAASGDRIVIAWAEEGADAVHVARQDDGGWITTTHPSFTASVRLASGGGAIWALWDAGVGTNCGNSYNADGVSLRAAKIEDDTLVGDEVSDQLWTHCYGAGYEIAVAPDGEPRVAYVVRDRVFHASRDGGKWVVEKGPIAERDTLAFTIDGRGRSHVLYRRDDVMWHGVRDGTWTQTKLTTEKHACDHPSIAVDAEGRLHIAYMNTAKSKDQLHYLMKQGDTVTSEIVDKKGNAGFGARIALAADGAPWIAYRVEHSREHAGSRRISDVEHRVATRTGDAWKTEVAAIGGSGNGFALADGRVRVAFAAGTRGNVALATRELR